MQLQFKEQAVEKMSLDIAIVSLSKIKSKQIQ